MKRRAIIKLYEKEYLNKLSTAGPHRMHVQEHGGCLSDYVCPFSQCLFLIMINNDGVIFLLPSFRETERKEKAHQRNTTLHLMIFFMSVTFSADIDIVNRWYDVDMTIRRSFSGLFLPGTKWRRLSS